MKRPGRLLRVCFQATFRWVLSAPGSVPEGGGNAGQVETSPSVASRNGIFFFSFPSNFEITGGVTAQGELLRAS